MSQIDDFVLLNFTVPASDSASPNTSILSGQVTHIANVAEAVSSHHSKRKITNLLKFWQPSPEDIALKEIKLILTGQDMNDERCKEKARKLLHCMTICINHHKADLNKILKKINDEISSKIVTYLALYIAKKCLFYFTPKHEANFLFYNILTPLINKQKFASNQLITSTYDFLKELSGTTERDRGSIKYLHLLTEYTLYLNELTGTDTTTVRPKLTFSGHTTHQDHQRIDEQLCVKLREETCGITLLTGKSNDFIPVALQEIHITLDHVYEEILSRSQKNKSFPSNCGKGKYIEMMDNLLHTLILLYEKIINYTIKIMGSFLHQERDLPENALLNQQYATLVNESVINNWQNDEREIIIPRISSENARLLYNAFHLVEIPQQTETEMKRLNDKLTALFALTS